MNEFENTVDPQTQHPHNNRRDHTPYVELLYHSDLSRIGLRTPWDAFAKPNTPIVFGRTEPAFISPQHDFNIGESWSLDDPCISREQLSIAWKPELLAFEVRASEKARRPTGVVEWRAFSDEPTSIIPVARIARQRLVEPGTCLAIGDRVLLWLDVMDEHGAIERMNMLGESTAMWSIRREIDQVARFQGPVLIEGETGTGKELVACAIHAASKRSSGPLKIVNCGALPENLVESMLFGHRKGAFTGASTDKPGLFQAAHGGTLFLDEIGELPLSIQQKLLRILQEGTFMTVGDIEEQKVDVRIIAATNRNLKSEVKSGRFRQDLYYRLSGHHISVPPLRKRRQDIPRLFMHSFESKRGSHPELSRLWRTVDRFKPPVPMAFFLELMRAQWSGNIRQLQNVAEKTARINLHNRPFTRPKLTDASAAPISSDAETTADPLPPFTPAPAPKVNKEHLSILSHELGIAKGTLAKLIRGQTFQHEGVDPDMLGSVLRQQLAEHLQNMLEEQDYKQARISNDLNLSKTTLHKIMALLGFPRPKDLTQQHIEEAIRASNGDLALSAKMLKVSQRGLQLRLTELEK